MATAFSLERGHQNQAFQGLHFMIFHHFLIRVVETCDCHPPSKALLTLSSIYGPIWHPICDPNLQYFALHFSCDFFTKYRLTSEISARHLRHKGGKGGTGRHLGGIWETSGRHLGGIWEASGMHLELQAAMRLQEARNHKNRCPSQLKCKSFHLQI